MMLPFLGFLLFVLLLLMGFWLLAFLLVFLPYWWIGNLLEKKK